MNVLDHLAIATDRLADGWELFGAVLGANWVYGGGSGFWFGQVRFAAGPKIEMLTPTAGPGWKEFFLHPRTAHGFVIQVAQEDNERPSPPPADYPEPGPGSDFELIE